MVVDNVGADKSTVNPLITISHHGQPSQSTLDRSFLSAWTLMGHEFVEMKNTHAAIESYRRAVDVNRKDYRAWYGLGQAYELLNMHQYSLHYYQRATALRYATRQHMHRGCA